MLVNAVLVAALTLLLAALLRRVFAPAPQYANPVVLDAPQPPRVRRNYTMHQLTRFNGVEAETPIYVAVNFKIFDVSSRRQFYGPEGPYALFAGRDASRALARADLSGDTLPTEWDDLEDLTASERAQLNEWEQSFMMKYDIVGDLVREEDHSYTATAPSPTLSANWEMVDEDNRESGDKN